MNTARTSLLLAALVTSSACGINNLPTYDEAANTAWSELQTRLQRRSALVPDVIELVQAQARVNAADQRRTETREVLLEQLIQAHSRLAGMTVSPDMLSDEEALDRFRSNQQTLQSSLEAVLMWASTDPDLASSESLRSLQDSAGDTANRIRLASTDYDNAVRRYNTELRTVPGRWWHEFLYAGWVPRISIDLDTPA